MQARWTRKAIAFAGIAAGLVALGMVLANGALVVAGGGFGGMLLLAAMQPLGHSVKANHRVDRDRLLEGDTITVEAELKSGTRMARILEVRDRLHAGLKVADGVAGAMGSVRKGSPLRMSFQVECPIAGVYDVGRLEVTASDQFGLRQARSTVGDGTSLLVYPAREIVESPLMRSSYPKQSIGSYSVSRAGIGMDFHSLRLYTTSDEMRMVDWKASARNGRLIVREYENESPAEATVFVDARAVAGIGSVRHNALSLGVRAAATLVDQLLADRNSVRLVIYGDELVHVHPGSGERHLHQILERLAEARPRGNDTFGDVTTSMLPRLKRRSPVFLVSPLILDDSFVDGASRLMAQGSSMTVVSIDPAACLATVSPEERDEVPVLAETVVAERRAVLERVKALGAVTVDWNGADAMAMAMGRGGAV